ncbi:MAG: histidinol-phosphatase HisJ family protein [Solirubrobacterales bacterium]
MLTDYHVHLRPDDPDTPPERYFTPENVDRYTAAAAEAGIRELGVSEHIHRFTASLDLWRHEWWVQNAFDDLAAYCEFVRGTSLRLGIEMDYLPGLEDRTASLLDSHDFDYVLGSVHFLGDLAVDHDGWDVWDAGGDADEIWGRYFRTMAEAARSELFDVMAHPDLVKVWGSARPGPRRDPRFLYEPFVQSVADSGVAVEVSTAGLRKPVKELFPAPSLAEMLVDAGAVFSLSSDAHVPEHVGHAYAPTEELMRSWGIEEIAVFEGRERRMEPLGRS